MDIKGGTNGVDVGVVWYCSARNALIDVIWEVLW